MRAESPRALGVGHQEKKIGTEITDMIDPIESFILLLQSSYMDY